MQAGGPRSARGVPFDARLAGLDPALDPRRHDEDLAVAEIGGPPGRVMALLSELVHAVEDESGVFVLGQDPRLDVLAVQAHRAWKVVLDVGLSTVAVENVDVRLTDPPLDLIHGESPERIRLGHLDLALVCSRGLRRDGEREGGNDQELTPWLHGDLLGLSNAGSPRARNCAIHGGNTQPRRAPFLAAGR